MFGQTIRWNWNVNPGCQYSQELVTTITIMHCPFKSSTGWRKECFTPQNQMIRDHQEEQIDKELRTHSVCSRSITPKLRGFPMATTVYYEIMLFREKIYTKHIVKRSPWMKIYLGEQHVLTFPRPQILQVNCYLQQSQSSNCNPVKKNAGVCSVNAQQSTRETLSFLKEAQLFRGLWSDLNTAYISVQYSK